MFLDFSKSKYMNDIKDRHDILPDCLKAFTNRSFSITNHFYDKQWVSEALNLWQLLIHTITIIYDATQKIYSCQCVKHKPTENDKWTKFSSFLTRHKSEKLWIMSRGDQCGSVRGNSQWNLINSSYPRSIILAAQFFLLIQTINESNKKLWNCLQIAKQISIQYRITRKEKEKIVT